MKAMKSWKKSLKHKGQPLLTYLNSRALKDSDEQAPTVYDDNGSVSQSMNSAFRELESWLLSSLQEVIISSVGSLKASFESEIRSFHTKVSELTERIQQLEEDKLSHGIPMLSMDTLQPSIETITVTFLLSEEKEKGKRKLNLILHRIPESTSEDAVERRVHDTNHVKSILQDYLKIDTQVDTVACIGKRDSEKTRLLKVDVPSEKSKKQVLHNSSKLRDDSNSDWVKKIFITPDLTPKEQAVI